MTLCYRGEESTDTEGNIKFCYDFMRILVENVFWEIDESCTISGMVERFTGKWKFN